MDIHNKLSAFHNDNGGFNMNDAATIHEKMPWKEVLEKLKTTNTTSIRDVCRDLQVSRQWVSKYILPFIHDKLKISNGHGKSHVNYLALAAQEVGRKMKDCVWLNTEEYHKLLEESVVSITRQTQNIDLCDFLKNTREKEEFSTNLKNLDQENLLPKEELFQRQKEIYERYLTPHGYIIAINKANEFRRAKCKHVPITLPGSVWVYKLQSVADYKDYGDSDEEVYREFFKQGRIRVEMRFEAIPGENGLRVFYIDPRTNIKNFKVPFLAKQEYL